MALETLKAQIGLLLSEMEERPEDAFELYEQVHEKLAEFRATGQPLPADLVELEHRLDKRFRSDRD